MHRTVNRLIAGTLLLCSAVAVGEESADYPVPLQEGKPCGMQLWEMWGLTTVVPDE